MFDWTNLRLLACGGPGCGPHPQGNQGQGSIRALDSQGLLAGREHGGKFPRLKLPCPVILYRLGEPRRFAARLEAITGEGLYFISPEPFAPLEKVEFEVPSETASILRCRAEVLCAVADWRIRGYGIACRVREKPWTARVFQWGNLGEN